MLEELDVYLSGEIHTAWREELIDACDNADLDINFLAPVCTHDESDNCGVRILGEEENPFWKDHKAAGINSIRIRLSIEQADIVLVKFGTEYKQWNAAFEAGIAIALGKPLIVMHPPEHNHALKDIDRVAAATVETVDQAKQVLEYISCQR